MSPWSACEQMIHSFVIINAVTESGAEMGSAQRFFLQELYTTILFADMSLLREA